MDIRQVKAIDVHSHFNHGSKWDSPQTDIYRCDIPYLEAMNRAANVEKMFCSTFASVVTAEADIEGENEYLYDYALKSEWCCQWVVIDPRRPKTAEQAARMLNTGKCAGIKLHPPLHGYRLYDWEDKIFPLAEQAEAFVEIHPEDSPTYLLPLAAKYPHVKIIAAHMNGRGWTDAIKMAPNCNIYADTSGSASLSNHVIEFAVSEGCTERIFYGSDTYAVGFQRGRIDDALISYEDKYAILRGNAEREFARLL